MAAHVPTVLRRSHWYFWLTWGLLLIPLVQLALTVYLPSGDGRPGIAILEGLVLWWAGSCATHASFALSGQTRGRGWLVLALLVFVAAAVQLIALHSAGVMSLVEIGLSAGLGMLLLLSATALVRDASSPGIGIIQAGFEALCLVSGTLVVRASIVSLGQDPVLAIEPALATIVLSGLIGLVGIPFAVMTRPRVIGVLVPLSVALACLFGSVAIQIWRPELAIPLRTLAWALTAIGAVTAHTQQEQHLVTLERPKLAGFAAPLLSWAVIALALLSIVATRIVPIELLALIVTGTLREVVAVLRRAFREDDLVLALLWERRRLTEERARSESWRRDVAHLVHDLAAPLNGIKVVHHVLTKAVTQKDNRVVCVTLTEEEQKKVASLDAHGELLGSLIRHLWDVLRGKSQPLRRKGLSALQIADDALAAVNGRARDKRVQATSRVETENWLVMADATFLRRVLDNLLANALDATPEGGAIKVIFRDDKAHPTMLTIAVTDEGPGLCEDAIATLFEPRPIKPEGDRMGQGLNIVRELTEKMEGAYGVLPGENGKGSQFWIRLPRYDH